MPDHKRRDSQQQANIMLGGMYYWLDMHVRLCLLILLTYDAENLQEHFLRCQNNLIRANPQDYSCSAWKTAWIRR